MQILFSGCFFFPSCLQSGTEPDQRTDLISADQKPPEIWGYYKRGFFFPFFLFCVPLLYNVAECSVRYRGLEWVD